MCYGDCAEGTHMKKQRYSWAPHLLFPTSMLVLGLDYVFHTHDSQPGLVHCSSVKQIPKVPNNLYEFIS